jgi:transcriptional regulator GlxA family with amidase domain
LFRSSVGSAPARTYLGLRLRRARQLLAQTRMSVTAVALACGFQSATHFSKAYRAWFGASPRQDQVRQRRIVALMPEETGPMSHTYKSGGGLVQTRGNRSA